MREVLEVQMLKQSRMLEYWRKVVFLPFLDCFINELEEHFKSCRSNQALKVHFLISSQLKLMNDADLEDIKAASECDMPSPSTISQK